MVIELTTADIIEAAAIIIPVGGGAVFWAVKLGVQSAIQSLELRIRREYMTAEDCRQIRAECDRHREREAGVVHPH